MIIIKAKTVEQSKTSIGHLTLPEQANIIGKIHGGEVIKIMDNIAGVAAARHAGKVVVTARVDEIEFHQPINIGNFIRCNARLTYVGNSSIEVLVEVLVEDILKEGSSKLAVTAFFTMVAIDKDGKPTAVPPLKITNEEESKFFEEGQRRQEVYKKKRNK